MKIENGQNYGAAPLKLLSSHINYILSSIFITPLQKIYTVTQSVPYLYLKKLEKRPWWWSHFVTSALSWRCLGDKSRRTIEWFAIFSPLLFSFSDDDDRKTTFLWHFVVYCLIMWNGFMQDYAILLGKWWATHRHLVMQSAPPQPVQ